MQSSNCASRLALVPHLVRIVVEVADFGEAMESVAVGIEEDNVVGFVVEAPANFALHLGISTVLPSKKSILLRGLTVMLQVAVLHGRPRPQVRSPRQRPKFTIVKSLGEGY
jgi:hypothetical protein